MSEPNSWIKIHRKIVEHWVFHDPMHLKIWVYLLSCANFKPSKAMIAGRLVTIERGDVLTSRDRIAEVCKCSVRTVRTVLDHLESDQMIVRKATRKATHLSITNYNTYQDYRPEERPHNRPQNDRVSTAERPQNDHIIRREEGKEGKEEEREEGKAPRSLSVAFKPPTIEEVQIIMRIRGLPDEQAELFHSYYGSQGWVKANGQPVRNWQQLIPSWITKYHKDKHNEQKHKRANGDRTHEPLTAEGLSEYRERTRAALTAAVETFQRDRTNKVDGRTNGEAPSVPALRIRRGDKWVDPNAIDT